MKSKIFLAVVAIAVAVAAGGCAKASDEDAAASAIRAAATYRELVDALFGTSEDRLAAEAESNAVLQQSIVDCMSGKGFSYTAAASEQLAGGPIVISDLTSLAPLGNHGFGISTLKQNVATAADARSNSGYTDLKTEQERATYGAALGPCISAAPDVEQFVPDGQGELVAELEKLFADQEKSPAAAAKLTAYGDCMAKAGFPVRNYPELHQLIESRFPDAGKGWKILESDPGWAAAVAFERDAADADGSCRSDLHVHVMSAVWPDLARFAEKHSTSIAAVKQQWSDYRAEVTK